MASQPRCPRNFQHAVLAPRQRMEFAGAFQRLRQDQIASQRIRPYSVGSVSYETVVQIGKKQPAVGLERVFPQICGHSAGAGSLACRQLKLLHPRRSGAGWLGQGDVPHPSQTVEADTVASVSDVNKTVVFLASLFHALGACEQFRSRGQHVARSSCRSHKGCEDAAQQS